MISSVHSVLNRSACKVPRSGRCSDEISLSSVNPSAARSAIAFKELGGSGACESPNGIT